MNACRLAGMRLLPRQCQIGVRRSVQDYGRARLGIRMGETRRFCTANAKNVEQAKQGAPPPSTKVTFKEGAKVATTGTIWIGVAALVGVCSYYVGRELMPSSMSPNSVFNATFDAIRDNPEVTSRLGDHIKAYGGDYNRRKEGRRNVIDYDQFTDLDGMKRIRVKFNMEGSRGKAIVYAEKSKEMSKSEFEYIILEQIHHGRRDAVALLDNRRVYTKGEMQHRVAARLASQGAVLYGHSNCQWTHRQINEFGEAVSQLKVLMCDKDENKDACAKAKLPGYPCWVIQGEQLATYHSLDDLEKICLQHFK